MTKLHQTLYLGDYILNVKLRLRFNVDRKLVFPPFVNSKGQPANLIYLQLVGWVDEEVLKGKFPKDTVTFWSQVFETVF